MNGITTSFLHSIYNGNIEQVKLYIKSGYDINVLDESGNNALNVQIPYGGTDMLKLLVENKVNVNHKGFSEQTPLHNAVAACKPPFCKLLLQNGADINARDEYGYTPLHVAVIVNHAHIAKILLEKGASIRIKDKKGRTPFDLLKETIVNRPFYVDLDHLDQSTNYNNVHRIIFTYEQIYSNINVLLCIRKFVNGTVFDDNFMPMDVFKLIVKEIKQLDIPFEQYLFTATKMV